MIAGCKIIADLSHTRRWEEVKYATGEMNVLSSYAAQNGSAFSSHTQSLVSFWRVFLDYRWLNDTFLMTVSKYHTVGIEQEMAYGQVEKQQQQNVSEVYISLGERKHQWGHTSFTKAVDSSQE